ncbi:MAG: VIT1/CCC1 transporter family protein [Clostridia bacterium]|nr:VIT1/CCC1 transporter family protein [Clostridia bacterium]
MKEEKRIIKVQRLEKTCQEIYEFLSEKIKNETNSKVLKRIAIDEKSHYVQLKKITKKEVPAFFFTKWRFRIMSMLFGITFGIKLVEKLEVKAITELEGLSGEAFDILNSESQEHEQALLDIIDEERLHYLGSIVLGLNDALVELSGALAGFTFALADTRLIAVTGLIMGISAALSMASSEYLSSKAEQSENGLKSSVYTGITYLLTVALLIAPYLILANPYISLAVTLVTALFIIAGFNYYMSVVQEFKFLKRFVEMALISLGVAVISFLIGLLVNRIL